MSLRIAILAPLKRIITPDTTVSRNRVIVDLVSELTARGHQVTMFAAGGSQLPGVTMIPVCPKPLIELPPAENEFYQHTSYLALEIAEALTEQGNFDIIHNHMYPEYLSFLAPFSTPMVTTVHSQMIPLTAHVLRKFPAQHLVAISHMAKKAAGIDQMDVVHNSVDTEFFKPMPALVVNENLDASSVANSTSPSPQSLRASEAAQNFVPSQRYGYLLAVGRMSKAKDEKGNFLDPKGITTSIAIAQKIGLPLKIVGNVEDPKFFETIVKPHLSSAIQFIGEVSSEQTLAREDMRDLFAGAIAFINPINWEEPFGLVMAEALSCGTPVVAFNRGAVSEIVVDGKTGFIIDFEDRTQNLELNDQKNNWTIKKAGIDGFVDALRQIDIIDRAVCRELAVTHFSKKRMVDEYEKVYEKILKNG